MDASFVIPCFQSNKSLSRLVNDLVKQARGSLESFEILLVKDSTDIETEILLDQLEQQFSEVRQLKLTRNFGQQAATVAGVAESAGDIVVTMDDDYQHKPSDGIQLIQTLNNSPGSQLIYGRPIGPTQSADRERNGKIFRKLLRFAGLDFAEALSPFRAFRGYLRKSFQSSQGPTVSVDVILSWAVDRADIIEFEFRSREDGASGYSRRTLLKLALGILLTYTTRPLRAGIYLGFIGVAAALIFASVLLVQYVAGGITVAGFASTALLILLIGSVQLLIMGLLGLYIGEQQKRGMGRPAYLIRQ